MKVCEEQSGEKVSENIKLAVLQEYLCDGELARHLNLQSSRLTTYGPARKEATPEPRRRGRRLEVRMPWTCRR